MGVHRLENHIMPYAWGDREFIPDLLGKKPGKPNAELWMGMHPLGPSRIVEKNKLVPLDKYLDQKLPFLFKVLCAGEPLSLQAHPSKKQAIAGFQRENKLGLALDDPKRSYKDNSDKPEVAVAVTPFVALVGFRSPENIARIIDIPVMSGILQDLKLKGLKAFFKALMTSKDSKKIIKEVTDYAMTQDDPLFSWILKLAHKYPEDIGILAPAYMNLVYLQPGDGLFLPAGVIHGYLDGVIMELLANSDNVIRAGLTPKYMDLPELLKIMDFSEYKVKIIDPVESDGVEVYQSPTPFELSHIAGEVKIKATTEIIICLDSCGEIIADKIYPFEKGMSYLITDCTYEIKGTPDVYRASVK